MGQALTMDSSVSCGHKPPGFVVPQTTAKLAVGGQRVLVQSSITTIGIGCLVKAQGDVACTSVAKITAGQSVKLFSGGLAVMLESLAGTTNGTISGVLGALTVVQVQAKLAAP